MFDSDTLSSDLLGEREVDLNLQVPLSLARPTARLPARPLARAQAARPLALSFDYSLHANERTRDLTKGRGTCVLFSLPCLQSQWGCIQLSVHPGDVHTMVSDILYVGRRV